MVAMRTTIDIPDPVYRRLKATAALRGSTIKQIVCGLVERELGPPPRRKKGHRVKLPLIHSKRPGTLHLTNALVNEILYP